MPKRQQVQKLVFETPCPFELYLPKGMGPFSLIYITPILGRIFFLNDLILERYFARFFSSHGFAVALVHRPIFEFNPNDGLEQIQAYLTESVSRNQKLLDFILAKREIDQEKVADFGISFGAVVNCLWASQDPRLKAHIFALGGGSLAEIFMTSRDPLMRSYFKAAIQKVGGRKEDLKEGLQKLMHPDPLEVCCRLKRENVLMVIALFDRVIQPRYSLALRNALGKPETIFLPLGHYASIATIPFIQWKALGFFRKKLGSG